MESSHDRRRLIEVAALLVGGLPIAFGLLRVLAVSRGDPTVFTAISENLNLTALFLSSFFAVVPFAIFQAILAVEYWLFVEARRELSEGYFQGPLNYPVTLIAISSLLLMSPFLLAVSLVYVVSELLHQFRRSRKGVVLNHKVVALGLMAPVLAPFVSLAFSPSIWLPAEKISIRRGAQDQVAAVLSRDHKSMVILYLKSDLVVRVDDQNVSDEQICDDASRNPVFVPMGIRLDHAFRRPDRCPK